MSFNPDQSKQAHEFTFTSNNLPVIFNDKPVILVAFKKHWNIYLDEKLNSTNHIKEKISKKQAKKRQSYWH